MKHVLLAGFALACLAACHGTPTQETALIDEITVKFKDTAGHAHTLQCNGLLSRCVQHEVDHLDGVLYPTRIKDLRKFGFAEELFPGVEFRDD